ncbi:unnamed protein product [Boreogadus saida]
MHQNAPRLVQIHHRLVLPVRVAVATGKVDPLPDSDWHPSNQVLLRASWEPPDHGAAPPVTARFDPTTPGLRTPTVSLWPPE